MIGGRIESCAVDVPIPAHQIVAKSDWKSPVGAGLLGIPGGPSLLNRRLPIRSASGIYISALEWDYPFGGGPLGLPGGPSLFSGKRFNPQPCTRPSGPRQSFPSKIAIARFGWLGRNTDRATGRATMSAIWRPSELVLLSAIAPRSCPNVASFNRRSAGVTSST
jgi:hypothetical protein